MSDQDIFKLVYVDKESNVGVIGFTVPVINDRDCNTQARESLVAFGQSHDHLILDFTGTKSVHRDFAATLVMAIKDLARIGKKLVLINVDDRFCDVLKRRHLLDSMIKVFPNLADAFDALKAEKVG